MARRLVKKNNKKAQSLGSSFFNTKGKIIGACVIGAVLLIVIFALMAIEGNNRGKMVVKNSTDLKLEYIKTYFVDEDGTVSPEVILNGIEAKDKVVKAIEPVKLFYTDANLEVRFKFEGNPNEFLTDVGRFQDDFDGSIRISLSKTDDPNLVKLEIKAKSGLFTSRLINCDETAMVDLEKGFVLE